MTGWGTRYRRSAALVVTVLLGASLAGCAPAHTLERLGDDRTASDAALAAADELSAVLHDLETQVAGTAPEDREWDTAREAVAAVTGDTVEIGSQARAFFEAHASQVERDSRGSDPAAVDVSIVDVVEADDQDGPVALVTLDTARTPVDGPSTTVRAAYALTWDTPGTQTDGPRLVQVRALHDDDGHPAIVDQTSDASALGVAADYVRAVRSGTAKEIDAFEGGVRSSSDLRDAMRGRLASAGRMTPVEVPCGRTGTVQVVYVVLDGDVPPLRLEVDVSGDDPVVNAYL